MREHKQTHQLTFTNYEAVLLRVWAMETTDGMTTPLKLHQVVKSFAAIANPQLSFWSFQGTHSSALLSPRMEIHTDCSCHHGQVRERLCHCSVVRGAVCRDDGVTDLPVMDDQYDN